MQGSHRQQREILPLVRKALRFVGGAGFGGGGGYRYFRYRVDEYAELNAGLAGKGRGFKRLTVRNRWPDSNVVKLFKKISTICSS
jgi:hypothetical protein